MHENKLIFPAASDPGGKAKAYEIPLFDMTQDPTGPSHVPFMNNFLDNSGQTALMREIASDLEVLGEHVLLLGNQVSYSGARAKSAPKANTHVIRASEKTKSSIACCSC